MRVLDPGPIAYGEIELFEDPDLERALKENGRDPRRTRYRLIEIPVPSIDTARTMPWDGWRNPDLERDIVSRRDVPPIVVMATDPPSDTWVLLDGVNRTHAGVAAGFQSLRAYELLD